ncbi:MAG: hypothetical protein M3Y09_02645 [Actinomycetota bacterium]|nr:hypothetical protein [Actinomycetota bacterium]
MLTVLSVTAFMVNLERVLWAANRAIAPGPSLPGSAVPSVRGSSDAGIPPASPPPLARRRERGLADPAANRRWAALIPTVELSAHSEHASARMFRIRRALEHQHARVGMVDDVQIERHPLDVAVRLGELDAREEVVAAAVVEVQVCVDAARPALLRCMESSSGHAERLHERVAAHRRPAAGARGSMKPLATAL